MKQFQRIWPSFSTVKWCGKRARIRFVLFLHGLPLRRSKEHKFEGSFEFSERSKTGDNDYSRGFLRWPPGIPALEYLHNKVGCYHDNKTFYDNRNGVILWRVMIHIESWAKSKIWHIFDLAQDWSWIMTPQSLTLILSSYEVLLSCQNPMLWCKHSKSPAPRNPFQSAAFETICEINIRVFQGLHLHI